MDTDEDWEAEDISDFTPEEQEEIRQCWEESRRIFANPDAVPELDPEEADRMWRDFRRLMGWAKP